MDELITAEKNVIGAILLDETNIAEIYEVLEPRHFKTTLYRDLYTAALDLYTKGESVNVLTLAKRAEDKQRSAEYIISIIKHLPSLVVGFKIKDYANILLQDYKRKVYMDIFTGAPDILSREIDTTIPETIRKLEELQKNNDTRESDALPDILKRHRHEYFNPDYERDCINTGFFGLDAIIGGIEKTDLVCIAARPSVGKSAFVSQMINYFIDKKQKVSFYSLEMPAKQVLDRILAFRTGISLKRIKGDPYAKREELERFNSVYDSLMEHRSVYIKKNAGLTVSQLRTDCRYSDSDVIIIDYLQLMRPEKDRKGNKTQEVGDISNSLKQLALEINKPIIILSQLNRGPEQRPDKEPVMSDLRDSGDIEQDCNIIVFLWNIDETNYPDLKGAKVAKNRQGERGKMQFKFDGSVMRFIEVKNPHWNVESTSVKPKKQNSFMDIKDDEPLPFD